MVAAYRVAPLEAAVIRRLVRVPSYILANLVLGRKRRARSWSRRTARRSGSPRRSLRCSATRRERRRQVEAFATLDAIMEIGSRAPAARAAEIVLGSLDGTAGRNKGRQWRPCGFC